MKVIFRNNPNDWMEIHYLQKRNSPLLVHSGGTYSLPRGGGMCSPRGIPVKHWRKSCTPWLSNRSGFERAERTHRENRACNDECFGNLRHTMSGEPWELIIQHGTHYKHQVLMNGIKQSSSKAYNVYIHLYSVTNYQCSWWWWWFT